MKTSLVAGVALAVLGLSLATAREFEKAEPVKSRPSQADLEKAMASRSNPLLNHELAKVVAPESIAKKKRVNELGGLVQRSTILAYGGFWTLVPKGSVLHVPPIFLSRLSSHPDGKLLPWSDFYNRNRGWIFIQPVGIANARGEVALSEKIAESNKAVGRVVVAVLHNGPISVKAPLSPVAGETANTPTPPKQ
jgi:hypothetical protein